MRTIGAASERSKRPGACQTHRTRWHDVWDLALDGGQIFITGEGAEPTEQSRTIVRRFAEQLIPSFKNAEEVRSYYYWHGDRISFDLDYAEKYLEDIRSC
jgi:hypothetical protein